MIFADNSFLYFFNLYHNKKSNTNKKGLYKKAKSERLSQPASDGGGADLHPGRLWEKACGDPVSYGGDGFLGTAGLSAVL